MSDSYTPSSRRGFLRALTTLPLIGGGIPLIDAPSAVAAPLAPALEPTASAEQHPDAALFAAEAAYRQAGEGRSSSSREEATA